MFLMYSYLVPNTFFICSYWKVRDKRVRKVKIRFRVMIGEIRSIVLLELGSLKLEFLVSSFLVNIR